MLLSRQKYREQDLEDLLKYLRCIFIRIYKKKNKRKQINQLSPF